MTLDLNLPLVQTENWKVKNVGLYRVFLKQPCNCSEK